MADQNSSRERLTTLLIEEDAEDLYEHAPCGYLSLLPDGLIVKVNETFLRWTGYERHRLVGHMRFIDLLTVGGRIFHETHIAPLLRMQGFVREIALDLTCGDGRRMPVLVNATLRTDEAGHPVGTRVTVFDATERRRYERELLLARSRAEEAAKARSNLVATISHDIRAPLSAIVTATALLEKTGPASSQLRYIRVLRSSCEHALALVRSVLDLSRLDAGQVTSRPRPFDIRQLARDVVSGSTLAAEQKPGLAVQLTVDDAVPSRLVGDPDQINQVLTNLMTNAVKFTERGVVSLVVALRDLGPESAALEVIVSDTGIGIPADRLPHIFEEYTQATSETAQKYGGTGLGLAISRKLLQLHGAELHVTSTLGQGTTFSFVLELRRDEGEGPPRSSAAGSSPQQ